MLQGGEDGHVDRASAARLAADPAYAARIRLVTYRGLGHTLGATSSAMNDAFLPIAPQPLDDLAHWLDGLFPAR